MTGRPHALTCASSVRAGTARVRKLRQKSPGDNSTRILTSLCTAPKARSGSTSRAIVDWLHLRAKSRPDSRRFPISARFDTTDTQQVAADTLDKHACAHGIANADFIKVDTQGSQLFVLSGGCRDTGLDAGWGRSGGRVHADLHRPPSLPMSDSFMRGSATCSIFALLWKRRGGPRNRRSAWPDHLGGRALPEEHRCPSNRSDGAGSHLRRGKILKAISVALLYGDRHYALDIAHNAGDMLSDGDKAAIEASLKQGERRRHASRQFRDDATLRPGCTACGKHSGSGTTHGRSVVPGREPGRSAFRHGSIFRSYFAQSPAPPTISPAISTSAFCRATGRAVFPLSARVRISRSPWSIVGVEESGKPQQRGVSGHRDRAAQQQTDERTNRRRNERRRDQKGDRPAGEDDPEPRHS